MLPDLTPTLEHVRKYFRPAGGNLAAAAVLTAGLYLVTVLSIGYPLPWSPWWLFLGVAVVGSAAYILGQPDEPARIGPPTSSEIDDGGVTVPAVASKEAATEPPPPVNIRLTPKLDAATGRFRLGALNRGAHGRFRVEVIKAHDQDSYFVWPQAWPVPWLEDGLTHIGVAPYGGASGAKTGVRPVTRSRSTSQGTAPGGTTGNHKGMAVCSPLWCVFSRIFMSACRFALILMNSMRTEAKRVLRSFPRLPHHHTSSLEYSADGFMICTKFCADPL